MDLPAPPSYTENYYPRCGKFRRPPRVGAGRHDRGGGSSKGGDGEPEEVASVVGVCKGQTPLGSEALSQTHRLIHKEGLTPLSNEDIRAVAYV